MKEKLVYFVKHNRIVYGIYYVFMSLVIDIIKLFTIKDNKLILFVSYGGRYFNESPRTLYEAMKNDPRFADYILVWAFRTPENFPEVEYCVKIDTLAFYKVAVKARCWVTNVAVERGLHFKPKSTFYFHTTHTTLPKFMGNDDKSADSFQAFSNPRFDCSCACSEYEAVKEQSMFGLMKENILLSGYPKNDNLTKITEEDIKAIKHKLNIPSGKKIILYAPTYRENSGTSMGLNVDIEKWKRILGSEYFVLFRAHPTMASSVSLDDNDLFVKDVSTYSDNTELMKIADILISDYSGIFFEFAVLERSMFCYGYDYDDYINKRQLYFDIRKELPGGLLDEEGLLYLIKNNPPEVMEQVNKFREKYVTIYGHATEICLDKIYEEIVK